MSDVLAPVDAARWVRHQVDALAPDVELPLYGSREWETAPENVQRASALRAAEAWRREGEQLADRLQAESFAAREEEADWQRQQHLGWLPLAERIRQGGPSYAELQQRRDVVPPGTGTYRGGPVEWSSDSTSTRYDRPSAA